MHPGDNIDDAQGSMSNPNDEGPTCALTALATVTIWRSKLKMDFSTEELLQKLELYMVYAAFCQNWINQVSNVKLLANITS